MLSRTQRVQQVPCAGRLPNHLHTGFVAAATSGQQHQLSGSTLTQGRCVLSAQQSVPQHHWADCLLQQASIHQQHPGDGAAGDKHAFAVLSQSVHTLAELSISCCVLADSSLCLLAASFAAPLDPSQYSSTPATSAWLHAGPGHRHRQQPAGRRSTCPCKAAQLGGLTAQSRRGSWESALCRSAGWQDPVP